MKRRVFLPMLATLSILSITACNKAESIEGRYNMTKGPVEGVVATFGKTSFALSTGASGNYEISDGQAILTGPTLSGVYKIEGDKLIAQNGRPWEFKRREDNDTSPINTGPRGGAYTKSKPGKYEWTPAK